MVVKFSSPLENAANFPPPDVLVTPKFRVNFLSLTNQLGTQSARCIFTKNGRGAIAIAGKTLRREGKNVILIPSYHCPALIEPFIWLGYEIRFYPVNEELVLEPETLENLLQQGDVTHCVLIRFFGFSLNIDSLRIILKKHNVTIIEDCAHAYFAFIDNLNDPYLVSNAQICSINKLLPTVDGGALYIPNKPLPTLYKRSWIGEFKGLLHLIGISQWLLKLKPSSKERSSNITVPPTANQTFRYFKPDDELTASYRHTTWLAKYSNLNKIGQLRRDNFMYLLERLQHVAAGRPLYTRLSSDDVPYVFPFVLHHADNFRRLRMKGVQVLRWEELTSSHFDCSDNYHYRLVQLPCHHQLSKHELDTIVNAIASLR